MNLAHPRLSLALAIALCSVCLGTLPLRAPRPAHAATPLSIEEARQAALPQGGSAVRARPTLRTTNVRPEALVPGRALVTFDSRVGADTAFARAASIGHVSRAMPEIGAYEVDLPAGWSVDDGIDALARLPGALGAEPDTFLADALHPNDPLYDQKQTSYMTQVDAEAAWDIQQGDPNVVAAVLDSGVDITHPDLATQIWTNPHPGTSGCGNDLHGCNFVDPRDVSLRCPNRNGEPVPNPDVSPYYFHGTMVAGVLGAATNNGLGVAGVVPHASIMAVRIGDCRGPTSAATAQGILYAINNGARVINLSSGGTSNCEILPAAVFNAVLQAQQKGVVITAAAGNDGDPCVISPANYPGVMAVSALSTFGDSRASFSNWGPEVAVAAPGVNLVSTSLSSSTTLLPPYDRYQVASGTSFSAPMVAGLADLLISQNPLITPDMVKLLIQKGATPLTDGNTPNWAGAGRIDMAASLRLVPAAYYGKVALAGVVDGATVEARIGGQLCGSGTVTSGSGQQTYTVFVSSAGLKAGCGTPGAAVSLSVGGAQAGNASWKSAAVALDLPGDATTAAAPPSTGAPSTPSASPAGAVLYHRGWNIVAAPAGTRFQAAGALFTLQPGDSGYESLQPDQASKTGYGYWAYFAADATVTFAADGPLSYTLTLPPGQWVLVGDPSATNPVNVTGADLAYTYDPIAGQYQQATTLEPGQGAWVFSSSGGAIMLQ